MNEIEHIFRAYDIRGIVGKELTPEIVSKIGAVYASYIGAPKKIAVAMDARTSSPLLKMAFISGAASAGLDIEDLGLLPIPLLNFYVWQVNKTGGVMITASHNPPPYNGIRFRHSDGTGFAEENIDIKNMFLKGSFSYSSWDKLGIVTNIDSEYVKQLYYEFVNRNISVDRELTIVVDTGNGAASAVAPYLFRNINARVISINSHPDGTFPGRESDPLKSNLLALRQTVIKCNADFGVAYDGDGDRAVFVDDTGRIILPEKAGIIFGKALLGKRPKSKNIVANISCSIIVEEELSKAGGNIIHSKVGDVFVAQVAKENNAILGIESSAHYFFPYFGFYYDDAIFGSLFMAEILSKEERKLSEIVNEIPTYPLKIISLECSDKIKFLVIDKLKEILLKEDIQFNALDGVKINEEGGWILVRPSNTEPIIRITIEGYNDQIISNIEGKYTPLLKNIIKKLAS